MPRDRYFTSGYQVGAAVARGELPVPCCDKAERRSCVCNESWACEEHSNVCIGSHE